MLDSAKLCFEVMHIGLEGLGKKSECRHASIKNKRDAGIYVREGGMHQYTILRE